MIKIAKMLKKDGEKFVKLNPKETNEEMLDGVYLFTESGKVFKLVQKR